MNNKYLLYAAVDSQVMRAHLRRTIEYLEYSEADDLLLKASQIYDEVGKLREGIHKLRKERGVY